jgi:hypothetical protein
VKTAALRRLTFSNVASLLALVLAIGGGGYALAASSGGGVLRACVGPDGTLRLRQGRHCRGRQPLVAWNQQGKRGPRGPKGAKGIQGVHGIRGPRGPGALSFDGQFPADVQSHVITTINGATVSISCGNSPLGGGHIIQLVIGPSDSSHHFYGFGTKAQDGTLAEATPTMSGDNSLFSAGTDVIQLDVVAESPRQGEASAFTSFDFSAVRGTMCNFHGLIIPGSPAT